jgi:hypothetical protein
MICETISVTKRTLLLIIFKHNYTTRTQQIQDVNVLDELNRHIWFISENHVNLERI